MSKRALAKLDRSLSHFLNRVPGAAWVRKDNLHTFSTAALCLLTLLFATTFILPRNPLTVSPLLAGIVTNNTSLIILEPENGSISAPMTVGTDSNASGNRYVSSSVSNTIASSESTLTLANPIHSKVLGSVLQAMTSEPIPPPISGCPLGTTTPTGQANPSEEAEPMGAIWCFPLVAPSPTFRTRVTGTNDWVDNFQTNTQMMRFADGDLDYRIFDGVNAGGTNKTQHFINNNHWMDDNSGGFLGGSMMRPNRSFKFENGMLVVEADVAAGIPCYQDGCNEFSGGDIAWPEIDVSTATQPTTNTNDALYGYGHFVGSWAVGCRLHGRGAITCAVQADHNLTSVTGDRPPCFSVDPARVMEISGFQQCGTIHYSYDDHADARQYLRHCLDNQMDMFCRDRFRLEITKSSLTLYVNGHIYLQDANWPSYAQLPDSAVNGNWYTYMTDWEDSPNQPVYRFHWGRLAINPHNADGTIAAPTAAPSFCLGQPQNTCQTNTTPPPPPPPPPTITTAITSPVASTTVSGVVNVAATASGGSGISKVELFVDGVSVGIDTASPYNFTWNSANMFDGQHQLLVKATDSSGNIAQSSPVIVTTSNGHPMMPTNTGVASMTFNAQTTGQYTVWTRMFATDANSDSYWLQIDNGFGIKVGDGGVPFGSWTWINHHDGDTSQKVLVNLTAGSHILKVIGREANTKIDSLILTQDLTFDPSNPAIVDATPPVVTLTSPQNGASLSGTTNVTLTATDDHAVSKVDLLVDNAIVSTKTPPAIGNAYTFALDTTKFTNGTHTLFAKATDVAGNSGSTSILSVNISNSGTPTPPPPPPQPPVGDLNGDNKVNILDISVMLRNWGALGGPSDLNHDGTVNIIDLSILLSHWTG